MAFEFNWRDPNRPSVNYLPADGSLKQMYSNEYASYKPLSSMVPDYSPSTAMNGYVDRGAQMQGYHPNTLGGPSGGQIQPDMAGYGEALQNASDLVSNQIALAEIDQQIQANNVKIAQLEAQLKDVKGNSAYADELDRQLAANRVKANDYANAQTHLGRIEYRELARLQREQAEKLADKNKATVSEKAKAELRGQIEDLDVAIPYYDNKASKDAAIAKRNRLVDQYNREYKASLPHYGESGENALTPDEWEQFKITNTDKNGNWSSDVARKLYSNRQTLSAAEAQKAKEGANTKTADEKKEAWNKVERDFKSAVDKHTNPAKYNGKTVTLDVNGKPTEFEVSYDSNNKRWVYKAKGHTIYKAVK